MLFRCWAEIDLDALRQNLAWIRHSLERGVKVITVVKADAYGHGLKPTARTLMQSGTDVFGVANLAEADAIRSAGRGWPVLMLGPCLPHELELVVREGVMPTISSVAEARLLAAAATRVRKPVAAHLKVDTGMGRIGVPWREAKKAFRAIQKLPRLRLAGIYTHHSSVESDADFSRKQRQRFETVLRDLRAIKPDLGLVHMNNTGGILCEQASTYNAVRPGLLVYGVTPSDCRPVSADWPRHLKPALTWKARVALVKEVRRGTPLSYGGAFIAPRRMSIATLTVGYGDGYLRSGTGSSHVLIHGKLCPIAGRITMDQTLIDVSHLKSVRPGDEAVLIGEQEGKSISVNRLADWCGTIPWEVLTSIAYRVPRVYRGSTAA